MMEVVVPLRLVAHLGCAFGRLQPTRLVLVVLKRQVDRPVRHRRAEAPRHLVQDMLRAVIQDRLHGIQPQPIHVELGQPIDRIGHVVFPHRCRPRTVECDGRPPWRVVPVGEELRQVAVQRVRLRAEVVVHHVHHDGDATSMALVHQPPQVVRPPVIRIGRPRQYAVIAPVAKARERPDRHQLNHCHAERLQVIQMRDHPQERTVRREGADVQLIQHRLRPGPSVPIAVPPGITEGIDDLAEAVGAVRLGPRRRIRHADRVHLELVAAARREGGQRRGMPPIPDPLHRVRGPVTAQHGDSVGRRRPKTKLGPLTTQPCAPCRFVHRAVNRLGGGAIHRRKHHSRWLKRRRCRSIDGTGVRRCPALRCPATWPVLC